MSASSTRPLSAPPSTFSISDGVTLKRSEKRRSGRASTGSVMCGQAPMERAPILARTRARRKFFRKRDYAIDFIPHGKAAAARRSNLFDANWHQSRGPARSGVDSVPRLVLLDDFVNATEAVHERRTGRQNVGTVDLVN